MLESSAGVCVGSSAGVYVESSAAVFAESLIAVFWYIFGEVPFLNVFPTDVNEK